MSREAAATVFAVGVIASLALGGLLGYALGDDHAPGQDTQPVVATVTLAPSGMAYCPTDPAEPHPTPCENRP